MSAAAANTNETQWDLSGYFPEFNGPVMKEFKAKLQADVAAALAKARSLGNLGPSTFADWEAIFLEMENLSTRYGHVASYTNCLASADAKNDEYSSELGRLQLIGAELRKLDVETTRCIKEASDADFAAFKARPAFEGARYMLDRTRIESKFTMSTPEEVLAADLNVDGTSAWSRLYDKIAGKLEFEMEFPDGTRKRVPMAQRRSLLDDADPRVRKAAQECGNRRWAEVEDVCAAALNHIAGARHTLNKHRGIGHFLDVALFQSSISRKTLDAMFGAIHATIEVPRAIARTKAKSLGQKALGWQDLNAPLPVAELDKIEWARARNIVKDSFDAVYPDLAGFLQHCYDNRWIESEPRPGKRPGAYCTSSRVLNESRIFMTYNGTLTDIRTLAHEVGHAFHNWVMRDLRPYARSYPMTLAESASTFAEMILSEGLLADPTVSKSAKASILNMELSHAVSFLLDIPVRFEFEKAMYEERAKGELTVARLKELMTETQRRIFGDTLADGGEDPYFWASKLHFYIAGVTFYNFPYTFGYLLSRGLFAQLKKQGPGFLPKYREFLRITGSDTAENVARRSLGVDLEQQDFWREAITSLDHDRKLFEEVM